MSQIHLSSMTKPKSILVATDLNDLEYLLPEAIAQATLTGATVWLVHVIPPETYAAVESGAYPCVPKEKAFRSAETALAVAAMELHSKNIACVCEVRRWFPVDQIKAFVREQRFERLILGTSGRGKAGKLLLGSVAEDLIRSLDIPVCTIGPHLKPFANDAPHRVIFATSLRHHPDLNFQFAADLASRLNAELTILHVFEQTLPDLALERKARATIDDMLKHAPTMPPKLRVRIRFGDPAEEILWESNGLKPEFLVLGAMPVSPLVATFRTGVAYKVIAQAPCPTFTFRDVPEVKGKSNGCEFNAMFPELPQRL